MKISERDKLLLVILGVVVVVALYVLLLLPQMLDKIETLKNKNTELELKVAEVEKLSNVKNEYKNLNAKLEPFAEKYLHNLDQERIILAIDDLLLETGLKGKEISFSLTDLETTASEEGSSAQKLLSGLPCLQTDIEFNGNYDGLIYFLNNVGKYDKKILVKELNIDAKSEGRVILEFYALSGLDRFTNDSWSLPNTAGNNNNPFIITNPVITNVATGSLFANRKNSGPYDIALVAKPVTSDFPTAMMCINNDLSGRSVLCADNKGIENVELQLFKQQDQYQCKYKLGANSYSDTIPFVSGDNQIVLRINSSTRTGAKDKSGVNLTLTNKTDKQLVVKVINEDTSNPRVKIVKQEGKISVQ